MRNRTLWIGDTLAAALLCVLCLGGMAYGHALLDAPAEKQLAAKPRTYTSLHSYESFIAKEKL